MKKATSLKVGWTILVALYVFTALIVPDALVSVGPTIIAAIAFSTVGYQGANVMDNWQRSKYYEPRLKTTGEQ